MSKRYTQVPISYLEPIFAEWMEAYKMGHLVNVFFLPYGDLLFRAMQFADWMSEKKGQEVKLINFETDLIVNPENLEEILEKYKDEKLVLLAKRAFMRPDAVAMVAVLEKWYAKEGKGVLIFHEGFPSEITHFVPKPVMMQAQMVHSCYPQSVTSDYVRTTAELFGVEVGDKQVDEIAAYCGGIPWLINDVLRRIGEDNLFSHTNLNWKVEQIAKSIPNFQGVEKDLLDFGLKLDKYNWIPIFQKYFDSLAKDKLQIQSDEIAYYGKDYSHQFSKGELRILKYLSESREVVNREELGKLFWRENVEREYSDWALDAIMSRLRKKLVKLSLPIVIKTRRGRGYECT